MKSVRFSKRSNAGNYHFSLDVDINIMFSGKFFVAVKSLLTAVKKYFLENKKIEKYFYNSIIGIGIIGILFFCYWIAAVFFTFIAALVPDRTPGAIAESGINFYKEYPVLAIITMIIALGGGFFLYLLIKDDSRKKK